LKDREFNSSDEIEEVITKARDELTFDEMQSTFHNWMSRLACVIENEDRLLWSGFLACRESQNRREGRELSLRPEFM
jgi:hypothetical protein